MQFGLSVHEGKTRLIEFGRFAVERRAPAGQRRPETFNFLGFTHYCTKTRNGKLVVKRLAPSSWTAARNRGKRRI